MNIATAAPAAIDEQLSRINGEIARREASISKAADTIEHYQKSDMVDYYAEAIGRAQARIEDYTIEVARFAAEAAPLNAEFNRRGGWTRYWLVEDGHLHYDASSDRCSRIFTTSHYWLTQFSGHAADEVIEEAGERVCTVCFPQAPVAVQNRSSRLFTATEAEKAKARTEREQKRAEAAKKASDKSITAPDGSVLVDGTGRFADKVTTEARAQAIYRDAASQVLNLQAETYRLFRGKDQTVEEFEVRNEERIADLQAKAAPMLAALAAKHDVTVETERAAHAKQVAAKARKDLKESLAWRAQNVRSYAVQDES